ncbi:DUF1189 family protein [Lederbergia wuyishanensis]|uniref:DUF1189 domain-containing protein n=1 Tax=Lederbergia wuyishanensis TaxID=1347903 RepID=A0ABU0D1E7_9BACI|nr:DUF1189 family protein [Lederbergia wuyishanensis]MCJ8006840.1 DUF1189 domain-containing protein [Lederbergia wuyishanensis]MDQ0342224.1 hypothetical protein [Lederbergia wuyishanensis]
MHKKSIFSIFIKCLYSFKDIAKFRFLGIGKSINYTFFLVFLYFLPSLYNTIILKRDSSSLLPDFDTGSIAIMLPIFIIFMYLLNTGIFFLKISILAGIAVLLAKVLNRKLPYRQSWRLTAFSITLPTLLFGLEPLLSKPIPYGTLFDFLISIIYIFFSIKKIPRPKILS